MVSILSLKTGILEYPFSTIKADIDKVILHQGKNIHSGFITCLVSVLPKVTIP